MAAIGIYLKREKMPSNHTDTTNNKAVVLMPRVIIQDETIKRESFKGVSGICCIIFKISCEFVSL